MNKFIGKIALMTATMLWAGCDESDKKADESAKPQNVLEQTKKDILETVKNEKCGYPLIFEQPKLSGVSPLYGCCKTETEYLEDYSFEENGVFVEVSKWTKRGKKSNRDFKIIEKNIRGEAKVLFDFYKSFFEKNQLYMHSVLINVSLSKRGAVKKVVINSPKAEYAVFEKQIVDCMKQLRFKGLASSAFTLHFSFYIPVKENKLSNWDEWQQALSKSIVKAPKKSDIVVVYGFGLDVNYIWYVCRRRTPMLRHISRRYLKKNPKSNGTVVLKIDIGFGGFIEKIEIDFSTTGYKEFDEDVRNAVSRWFFGEKQIQGTIKIPFTFYRDDGAKNL